MVGHQVLVLSIEVRVLDGQQKLKIKKTIVSSMVGGKWLNYLFFGMILNVIVRPTENLKINIF